MILEKIKEQAGKISFFVISVLLMIIGVLLINKNNQPNLSSNAKQPSTDYTGIGSSGAASNNANVKTSIQTKTPSATTKVS